MGKKDPVQLVCITPAASLTTTLPACGHARRRGLSQGPQGERKALGLSQRWQQRSQPPLGQALASRAWMHRTWGKWALPGWAKGRV